MAAGEWVRLGEVIVSSNGINDSTNQQKRNETKLNQRNKNETNESKTKSTKTKRNRLIWRKWKGKNKRQNEIKK
jgi:hypothetical protein